MKQILFVCLGNICRSPIAEGIARARFAQAGLAVDVASAALGGWHVGSPPDRRAIAAAWHAGVDIGQQRARLVNPQTARDYDLVLGMDRDNVAALVELVGNDRSNRVRLMMDFSKSPGSEIPDPYYGGHQGFDEVVSMVEEAVRGLVVYFS